MISEKKKKKLGSDNTGTESEEWEKGKIGNEVTDRVRVSYVMFPFFVFSF